MFCEHVQTHIHVHLLDDHARLNMVLTSHHCSCQLQHEVAGCNACREVRCMTQTMLAASSATASYGLANQLHDPFISEHCTRPSPAAEESKQVYPLLPGQVGHYSLDRTRKDTGLPEEREVWLLLLLLLLLLALELENNCSPAGVLPVPV
jgi:hypothetical protein